MKKLLFALAALALVILLLPMQEAKADWHYGDTCPGCSRTDLVVAQYNGDYHNVICTGCNYFVDNYDEAFGLLERHSGGTATCQAQAVCEVCDQEYGEIDANNHDLIDHDAQAPTCTAIGWDAYQTCSRCDYTTYEEKAALGHDLVDHAAQAATCTAIGWDAYDTCSRCDYTTYVEKAKLGHDLIHHDAQAATCTAIGWDAYDTCSRCDYTTYAEIPALGHDLVHHDAQAPTCTEIGWDAYDTCSRCDYTTYAVIPAKGHTEAIDPAVPATCAKTGLTEGKHCAVCGAVLEKQLVIPALGHVFGGSWQPAAKGRHAKACGRCGAQHAVACALTTVSVDDENTVTLCPVCGYFQDMENMEAVSQAKASGKTPGGNLRVFLSKQGAEPRLLTVAFESGGKLLQPQGEVTISLPAKLLSGYDLMLLSPDGEETPIECGLNGGKVSFILSFTQDGQPAPAAVLLMIPKN
ncbi:MAG: hypothetical protein IKQ41_06685 [Clostridia bacterium]|nr:hypothetical protein [Clostridia bacterium]